MRIWSIHPKYLDTKGLVALWRETLLAKNVLNGHTKGYKNHPQLDRFKKTENPVARINQYLSNVYKEAVNRNYKFNKDKIDWDFDNMTLSVTEGQIHFETKHLLRKLKERDPEKFSILSDLDKIEPHPLFVVIKGQIEKWEIL